MPLNTLHPNVTIARDEGLEERTRLSFEIRARAPELSICAV